MAETRSVALGLSNSIIEDINLMLPMEPDNKSDFMIEAMQFFIKERKKINLNERLKEGYKEMSQINLTLAEIGLEQDNLDLRIYEARITGRGI